jgi:DNA-nicking Smr family endonuclease
MDWFEGKLDEIDAAIFTGDALAYGRNPEILKEYIERWLRELSTISEVEGEK